MNNTDDDYYERQSELLEQFLSKNDKTAFMKMLNMNVNPTLDKEKEQKRNPNFMKSMKNKSPKRYYDYFHMKQPSYHNHNHIDDDLFNNNYRENQINNFKIDFHNIIQDPQYKDKSMKGNYKWGQMKFNMLKLNLAKRRGISIDDLYMPKIACKKQSQMEMNGQFIMNNNPLAQSMNERRIPGGIRNSLKIKMGMVKINQNQESSIKRQYTQKVQTINQNGDINKLDINF